MIDAQAARPVWRRDDLLLAGVSDPTQVAMMRRGLIVRLRHGIVVASPLLAQADPRARHRIDLAAAIAACSEPAWVVGPSAALLRGMPMPADVPTHLHLLRAGRQDLRSLTQESKHRLTIPPTSTLSLLECGSSGRPRCRGSSVRRLARGRRDIGHPRSAGVEGGVVRLRPVGRTGDGR